jgi:hypothetical protein
MFPPRVALAIANSDRYPAPLYPAISRYGKLAIAAYLSKLPGVEARAAD